MGELEIFNGFPEEGLQFLRDIEENNNKEWFAANKATYENALLAPAQSFVAALGRRLQELDSRLVYDPRTDGRGVLMRFYRDTRFSSDKSPYKTNISGMFTDGAGKKTERPSFGFHMGAGSMELMAGMFGFSKSQLIAFRDAVAAEGTGSELAHILQSLGEQGSYHLAGEHYKRVPSGYDPGHPRAHLLRFAGLYTHPDSVGGEHLKSPLLVDICLDHFAAMASIYLWLYRNVGGS